MRSVNFIRWASLEHAFSYCQWSSLFISFISDFNHFRLTGFWFHARTHTHTVCKVIGRERNHKLVFLDCNCVKMKEEKKSKNEWFAGAAAKGEKNAWRILNVRSPKQKEEKHQIWSVHAMPVNSCSKYFHNILTHFLFQFNKWTNAHSITRPSLCAMLQLHFHY